MSTVDNERPPYVQFERRAVEDRTASNTAGHYVSRDVDFAIVTRPGARDTVEKPVADLIAGWQQYAKSGSIPLTWVNGLKDSYRAWKEGEDVPTEGTPIKGWPPLSPAAQKDLIHAGVRTVEDLANLPDQDVASLVMGGIAFKLKAKSWLEAAKDTGRLAEQMTSMAVTLDSLKKLSEDQAAEIARLRALVPEQPKAAAK
jgi:hypothetical protein